LFWVIAGSGAATSNDFIHRFSSAAAPTTFAQYAKVRERAGHPGAKSLNSAIRQTPPANAPKNPCAIRDGCAA
jgi:hypothetical protein